MRPIIAVAGLMVSCVFTFAEATEYIAYPKLPKFLSNNPLPDGYPWGLANATNTNPDTGEPPDTGVTRSYEFRVSRGDFAPDGFNRSGILVNGQFPGPLIEANWGDTIKVKVINELDEGTAMHWHGQHMRLTPEADGVPSVTQCPIAPGKEMTYSFRAEQYGSSWYHSHFSGQYMDGAFGALVIYGPRTEEYDEDLGPIMLADHYHDNYYESIKRALSIPPIFDVTQNNLVAGKMDTNCLPTSNSSEPCDVSKLARFRIEQGKTYLLRLINSGSTSTQKFSIDDHELLVIANDYVSVKPYSTKVVTLGIGQRSDVLVTATGKAGENFWMRSEIERTCFPDTTAQPLGLAVVSYPDAPEHEIPAGQGWPIDSRLCLNDPLDVAVPEYPIKPAAEPAVTQEIHIDASVNATGFLVWTANNQSFRGNYNNPILLHAKLGNTSYPDSPQWNVYNFEEANSIRLVLYNYWPLPHPMHLHGHNMFVLAEGNGAWDGTVTNPDNPTRRDVHLLGPGEPGNPSFVVLQYDADNPGVWPLHCHIVTDVGLGLYVNLMEKPEQITGRKIPPSSAETCREWWTFSDTEFVNQIDSGL